MLRLHARSSRSRSLLGIFLTACLLVLCITYTYTHRTSSSSSTSSSYTPWAYTLAEAILPDTRPSPANWELERQKTLAELLTCKYKNSCSWKQKHTVISAVTKFTWALDGTFDRPASFQNGEAVLGRSWFWGLKQLGYPVLHIADVEDQDIPINIAARLYSLLGDDMVSIVLLDYYNQDDCVQDKILCSKSADNPNGIPEWKIFQWDSLGAVPEPEYRHPWGLKSFPIPEKDTRLTHIGFEIETSCEEIDFVPPSEKENMIYVYGKLPEYFDPSQNPSTWPNETYSRIIDETGLRIEAGILTKYDRDVYIPDGITNVGTESRREFMARIASAKILLGVGRPHESPTPLEGLCGGTPYINIEFHEGWHQHPMLGRVPEPYVYQVPALNMDALLSSIHKALKNPLEKPYVPEEVSKKRFLERLKWLVEEEDWEKKWRDARREYPPGKEWDVDY